MKKSILLIHGAGDDARDWTQPFLAPINAISNTYDFRFPKMPASESSGYHEWKEKIKEEIKSLSPESILIGHSLGASVLIKLFAEERPDKKFDSLYLIGTPFWGEPDWQVEEFELERNFSRHLTQFARIYILHNEDDDFVPFAHRDIYAKKIPAAIVLPSLHHGHLSTETMEQVVNQIRQDHRL